jgi:hypothetical protein
MFQKSFYILKTLKKNMWKTGFFVSKVPFLIKCSPNHSIFCELWYIPLERIHVFTLIYIYIYIYIYALLKFDTQTSLNMLSWFWISLQEITTFWPRILVKKNPPFGFFALMSKFDQSAILDKSIWPQSFWLGFFTSFFYWTIMTII